MVLYSLKLPNIILYKAYKCYSQRNEVIFPKKANKQKRKFNFHRKNVLFSLGCIYIVFYKFSKLGRDIRENHFLPTGGSQAFWHSIGAYG